MGGLICTALVVVGIVALTQLVKTSSGPGLYDKLVANGVPARGILLQVSNTGIKSGSVMRRFDSRSVLIDVEMPGRPPFELQASPIIPTNLVRDVLPGATVELRVDPKNPRKMAIVGPGSGLAMTALVRQT